ncbi:MAG: UxaA family hydrolase [Mediterraneibacter gnavus]
MRSDPPSNAAGVLVLGLGCENSNIEELKNISGTVDESRQILV